MRVPTVTTTSKEGHPVDGNGHGAMLVVEVVDVVGGAETGGDASSHGRAGEHQQRQGEDQPEQVGRTGTHYGGGRGGGRPGHQEQASVHLHQGPRHRGGAWLE